MHQHPTSLRKLGPIQKAQRLLQEDRVMLSPDASVYQVLGDSATYDVIASAKGIFCPCESRAPLCSHVLAVAQLRERTRVLSVKVKCVGEGEGV